MSRGDTPLSIAWFISPHGFGHAAREAAVIAALHGRRPDLCAHLFTTVPEWLFADSLPESLSREHHREIVDIGLVQESPLKEDLNASIRSLTEFMPFREERLTVLSEQVRRTGAKAIVCDLAPIGVLVASRLGIPSIVVGNFFWDWIYEGYAAADSRFHELARYVADISGGATLTIDTEPVCAPSPSGIRVPPVARVPRRSRAAVRNELGIDESARVIMFSMGGMAHDFHLRELLRRAPETTFIVCGATANEERDENVILLPHRSRYYHPDLLQTVDVLFGKVGYSTVAEACILGTPFAYVVRPQFRESAVLAEYLDRHLDSVRFTPDEFESGSWFERFGELATLSRRSGIPMTGAAEAADAILRLCT